MTHQEKAMVTKDFSDRYVKLNPYLSYLEDDIDLDLLSELEFDNFLKKLIRKQKNQINKTKKLNQDNLNKQLLYLNYLVKETIETSNKINKLKKVLDLY